MSRSFEIYDSRGCRKFSDTDLPLEIGGKEGHVQLESVQEVIGYIGDSKGHLFFQPAERALQVLHNDRNVQTSVWIKSGDITRIGDHLVQYAISGDRVEICILDNADKGIVPPQTPLFGASSQNIKKRLPRKSGKDRKRIYRSKLLQLTGLVFLALLLAAFFVLKARLLEITISPKPESVTIKGFPPVIKLGPRFMGLKGEYILQAEKQGYQMLEMPVTISEDQTANQYSFTLEKLPGLVNILSDPVGAKVFVDENQIGLTPLHKKEVTAGSHTLRIEKKRYLPLEQTITIEGSGKEQHYDFTLAPGWSTVRLNSEPPEAEATINGQPVGLTPLKLELMQGSHAIVFQKQDYSPVKIQLNVPAGEEISAATVVLKPVPAILEVASAPIGASVLLDSVFQGQTPVSLETSSRQEHTLILSLAGYENHKQKILAAPSEKIEISPVLTPEYGTIFLTTDPPDAELFINGKSHGKATGRIKLPTRQHTLELRAKGYKTKTRTVTPKKEYSRQLEIRLQPEGVKQITQKPIQTQNSNQEMILLQPASFQMGSSGREPGRRANEQLRQVTITKPFYLGVREVTNKEFRRFKPGHASGVINGISLNGDNQPVVNVTWEDAVRYLNWLSKKDGLEPFYREEKGTFVPAKPMTTGYRLPFESEWAYAARYVGITKPAKYPWPGPYPPNARNGNYADESAASILSIIIKGYFDAFPATAPVASFPRNNGNFFDIGGNASEWCHDYYSPYISLSSQKAEDPMGPKAGVHHVVRGSSWRDGSITELRLSYRSYSNHAQDDIGFRIARFAQ